MFDVCSQGCATISTTNCRTFCHPKKKPSLDSISGHPHLLPQPPRAPFPSVDGAVVDVPLAWPHIPRGLSRLVPSLRSRVFGVCPRGRRAWVPRSCSGRGTCACAVDTVICGRAHARWMHPRGVRVRGGHGRLWVCACVMDALCFRVRYFAYT